MTRWIGLAALAAAGGTLLFAWPAVPAETGPQRAKSLYGYPFPSAPDCDERASERCARDAWGLLQGQCTSWVAFRVNHTNQVPFGARYRDLRWGDAVDWARVARRAGLAVDDRPALGAIAWYGHGHVAYVERVQPGAVVISEMNFDDHNGFRTRTVTPGHDWPDAFIHVGDLYTSTSPAITPGTAREV